MNRLIAWISDLRVAIGLLILIAAASGLGTFVPQKEAAALYHRVYDAEPLSLIHISEPTRPY